MTLYTAGHLLYEPLLGLVLFEMRDERDVVHCIVSECALRNSAQLDGETDNEVEDLSVFTGPRWRLSLLANSAAGLISAAG